MYGIRHIEICPATSNLSGMSGGRPRGAPVRELNSFVQTIAAGPPTHLLQRIANDVFPLEFRKVPERRFRL
jgi:hypothetical protein